MIDISKLDKARVLMALYNRAKPQGLGMLHYDPAPLGFNEARELIRERMAFDYLKGRVMKVKLGSDELDPWLYDRDNGPGAAARALAPLLEWRDHSGE